MNTYDFDETIYVKDSSVTFYKYCLRKYPGAVWRTVPRSLVYALRYAAGRIRAKELKQQLFSFLKYLGNVDAAVSAFWDEKFDLVGQWYLAQKRDDDIIISASPEFLLAPAAQRLGVRLIGTVMDKRTGAISGENCHDSEKVRRFRAQYPDAHTECFYSDSLSDTPMAEIAGRAFLVDHGKLSPWPGK